MNIITVRRFFMWCTIINGALLIISFLIFATASDWVYQIHNGWFSLSREAFNIAIYCFMGVYKIFFIALNLVPYLALAIIK